MPRFPNPGDDLLTRPLLLDRRQSGTHIAKMPTGMGGKGLSQVLVNRDLRLRSLRPAVVTPWLSALIPLRAP